MGFSTAQASITNFKGDKKYVNVDGKFRLGKSFRLYNQI